MHQWTKKSSARLPDEVAKLLMKKVLRTNLLLMKLARLDERAADEAEHADNDKNPFSTESGFLIYLNERKFDTMM